jgi:hypothetical protein
MRGSRGNKESRGTFRVAFELTLSSSSRVSAESVVRCYCYRLECGDRLVYVLAAGAARPAKGDFTDMARYDCGVELGEPFPRCSHVVIGRVRSAGCEGSPDCGSVSDERREAAEHGTRRPESASFSKDRIIHREAHVWSSMNSPGGHMDGKRTKLLRLQGLDSRFCKEVKNSADWIVSSHARDPLLSPSQAAKQILIPRSFFSLKAQVFTFCSADFAELSHFKALRASTRLPWLSHKRTSWALIRL